MNVIHKIKCHPLTPERWHDFEKLFGPRGAYGGCWCMWWRLSRKEFEQQQGAGNKQAMKNLIGAGTVPGILGYVNNEVAAWCSVAPREDYSSLNRSRVLKPIDDRPVWSIVCFYVAKPFRAQGTLLQLIQGAIEYVKKQGGEVVEAYPTVPRGKELPPVSSFMGFPEVYKKAGFEICARPSIAKMIMRYYI
jgi:hypothetical protein